MSANFKEVFIRFRSTVEGQMLVPVELRQHLIDAAAAEESNITEVVLAILALRYGVPHEPSGRTGRDPDPDVASLKVRVPIPLHQAISHATRDVYPNRTIPDEIRIALCEHYGLEFSARSRVAA